MATGVDKLASELQRMIEERDKRKKYPYDTEATVTRVEGDIAWVKIPGGIDETPAQRTIGARPGDSVQLRVSGGRAYLIGNGTNPPTDDRVAYTAMDHADVANENASAAGMAANEALDNANIAAEKAAEATNNAAEAKRIVDELEESVTALDTRVDTAEGNITTIEGNISSLSTRVTTAEGQVSAAQTNITNLQGRITTAESDITAVEGDITSLQGRVVNAEDDINDTIHALGVAESVVNTINWIAEHGNMESQAGKAFDANNVYFQVDPSGVYVVGSTRYSVVESPVASDINNYYILATDSSMTNYIASHITLTNSGLIITKDSSKWYILLKNDGVDIIDNTSGLHKVVASYGTSIILGENNNSQSHAELDYHSFQLVDMDGEPYFYVSDFREKDGFAKITEKFIGNGRTKSFTVNFLVQYEISASDSSNPNNSATCDGRKYTFTNAPADGATVTIVYKTSGTNEAKAFTIGLRDPDANVGMHSIAAGFRVTASGRRSFAEGYTSIAGGTNSHAEGTASEAQGQNSHAEGYHTLARENSSHAQNTYTIAGSPHQTAMGKYNVPDYSLVYALIIGNGTAENARSNALTVAWNGDVVASGDVTDGNGNVLSDKIEMSDIPTDVSAFTNDVGYLTNFTETDPTVPSWAKAPSKPTYMASEISGLIDMFYPVGSYYKTSDANFNPNTAWGGTWSSEEIVDDEIVEQTKSGIWTYRKWKSGISECWGRRDVTISLTDYYGGAYYKTDSVSFPTGVFNAEPVVTATRQGRAGAGLIHISTYAVSSSKIEYFITNTNASYPNAPLGISFEAKGLWKTYSAPSKKYRWHRTA